MQKENNEIKIELHKYQKYASKILSETIIHETIEKKKALLLSWTWTKWRKQFLCYRNSKTRITYKNKIDGIPEYELDSPTEEKQEKDNNYEI